jgi:DNA-nicking Smr family endonuclease
MTDEIELMKNRQNELYTSHKLTQASIRSLSETVKTIAEDLKELIKTQREENKHKEQLIEVIGRLKPIEKRLELLETTQREAKNFLIKAFMAILIAGAIAGYTLTK